MLSLWMLAQGRVSSFGFTVSFSFLDSITYYQLFSLVDWSVFGLSLNHYLMSYCELVSGMRN